MRSITIMSALFTVVTAGCTPIDVINNWEFPLGGDSDDSQWELEDSDLPDQGSYVERLPEHAHYVEPEVVVPAASPPTPSRQGVSTDKQASQAKPVAVVAVRDDSIDAARQSCFVDLQELDVWCKSAENYEQACLDELQNVALYCGRVDSFLDDCVKSYGQGATQCRPYVHQEADCAAQHKDMRAQLDDAQAQLELACSGAAKLRMRCESL